MVTPLTLTLDLTDPSSKILTDPLTDPLTQPSIPRSTETSTGPMTVSTAQLTVPIATAHHHLQHQCPLSPFLKRLKLQDIDLWEREHFSTTPHLARKGKD